MASSNGHERGHAHGHHHHGHRGQDHARAERSRRKLLIVLALTAVYMLAEAVGGWWTGSLALLADAGHMLTDVGALALALVALWFASRPATPQKTFGYYRLEILAAFVNGVALVVLSLFIFYEAYGRWLDPNEQIKTGAMMVVAAGGLVVNLACAWLLHGDHETDLNVRGAWLHILGDAAGSVAAITAGALMSLFGWYAADPVLGALIGLLIIWSSWKLIREAVNVLLEGTPAHINLASVEDEILATRGVEDVHDLHVWTITSGREALSAHVKHARAVAQAELLAELRAKLRERFGVDHLTIQMETEEFEDEPYHLCNSATSCFRSTRE